MQVKLIRTWGDKPAHDTVDTDDIQGQWLIDHGFATFVGDTRTHEEIEGALKPTHALTNAAITRSREETGVSGAVEGSPDAVHNRIHPKPTAPGKPNRRTKSA